MTAPPGAARRDGPYVRLEPVMGTLVGISTPEPLPRRAAAAAVHALHEADRIFSTWRPDSPLSRVRRGVARIDELDLPDAVLITDVLVLCATAREWSGGAFDPWAMPGGVDPTGLVKGWAVDRALHDLALCGVRNVLVNAGGDIGVLGRGGDGPWRVGIRHPAVPDACAAVVEIGAAVATSGDYERPGHLLDPATGRAARATGSATVTGPRLALADALATALAVAGPALLPRIEQLPEYEGYVITAAGRHYATPGMPFAATDATPSQEAGNSAADADGHDGGH